MPDEDIQDYPLDETVDKVDPEFGGLKKQEAMSIFQVLDKPEDVSDALLSRFDSFYFITGWGGGGNYALIIWYFNNLSIKFIIDLQ